MSETPQDIRTSPPSAGMPPARESLLHGTALYPLHYVWYVFFSALDVLFTWAILRADGREENVIANWIITHFDLSGVVIFKFALVAFVVIVCEIAGRRRETLGRKLAEWALILSAFPAAVGGAHLLRLIFHFHGIGA